MSRFPNGAPICLVTMTGRRTGKKRTIPLIHVPHGNEVILIASQGGMSPSPLWFHNLSANPDITISADGGTRRMRARRVDDAEKAALWPSAVAVYPDFDDYQARTERNIPVFLCSPI
jgi:deazaflavin-dependent oxidoreductase (nitroreductase family)